jgi:glucan-binding YG repeat protein
MKKYLKNGLSILTCVAMCVQSPLAVLAEDATEVQNEMQSETPVVQPTDLQTLDQQIATYANESNQSEIFCTVMGDPNLNKEHIESHTKTFVKVKGDDNKDHYKLSEESQQYVDGIYEIRFNDGCIWKLHFDKNGYLNTGWQNDNGSWYYFDPNYFLAIRDTPYQITDESNNTWVYYFDRDGIMQTEYWYPREVGIWSYFDKDGHMVYGWNQIAYDQKDYQTHYFDSEGIELVGWQKIDGKWYYFDKNVETYGIMETGWLLYENTWYYLKATGEMASDEWVDGGKYYVDANGVYIPGKVKVTGSWLKDNTGWWYRNTDGTYPRNQWQYIDGNWYHFDQNGYTQTGWLQLGNTWYYLNSNGAMQTGWQKIGRDWYYLNASGDMRTGWLQSGNVWYYLKSNGAMATNEWVDGGVYYVDANGIYIPGKTQTTGSWQKDNTGWWYRNADGSYPTDKWEEINSKWYHFNTSGYMETGWITTGDLWYHLAESGELTCGYPNGGETVKLTKTVNATCTTDGYQEYTCSKCGETHQVMLPKTGHNYQVSKKVDATCTADGYDVYTCSNCKDTYTKTTQQKLGHDFSKKIDHKDSTCTVKGFDLYQCSRCDETKKTELALVDHNYQLTKTVKATCTADGYKEYTCSMCNKSYQEKLPKTGHDYDMNTEVERVDSTCSTHGHVNYACKVCGDIKTVELDLNPENHSYTETGRDLQYIYYKCSECGAEKKEFNDQEYTIDLGNGKTTTVVGHFDLEMRDKILEIINEKRAYYAGGIPLLSLAGDTTSLQDAANTRAIEITYSYSHTRPNGNRAITDLYPYAHTDAENLAKGQSSAEQVCDDWFSSPTHNRNIVNNSYRTIGISVFCQKLGEDDYVNNFSQLFSTLEHY